MANDRIAGRLKFATRRLVEQLGGVECAASIARPNKTRISDYQRSGCNAFIPIDCLIDLEADIGEPIVTRVLAETLGYALVRRAPTAGPRKDPGECLQHIMAELGDVARAETAAMADGKRSPSERRIIAGELHDLIDRAREMLDALDTVPEQPAIRRAG